MRIGTSYFVNLSAANRYYGRQGDDAKEVQRKIEDGEIEIGVPKCPLEQRAVLDADGRYHLEDI